jgi:hypothetical protein
MSGDVWVFGLNAWLAWWLIHRVRVADRVDRAPARPLGEEDRQN